MSKEYTESDSGYKEKFSNIKSSFIRLLKRFGGYDINDGYNNLIKSSEPLLGEEVITKVGISLEPFVGESMLISKKDPNSWYRQRFNTAFTMLRSMLTDMGCPHENMGLCFESYYNVLKNTGDIFLHSRELTERLVNGNNDIEKKEEL